MEIGTAAMAAPIITPKKTKTLSSGAEIQTFGMGKTEGEPDAKLPEGDGKSYVSGIQLCKANQKATTITGFKFTMTHTLTGVKIESN